MLLTNWLNTLTSRIKQRPVFRSRDRRAIRRRWQAIVDNQIATTEALEDRTLLTTFTVENLDASGTGSLADAIDQANANAGLDTIVFQTGLSGTINAGTTLHIEDDVIINGDTDGDSGTKEITVTGNDLFRVFTVENANATFSNFAITAGEGNTGYSDLNGGGGILALGNLPNHTLTLQAMEFSENESSWGAAVHAYNTIVSIEDSLFFDNIAAADSVAGDYSAQGGAINITESRDEGVIHTITGSTFVNNQTTESAGLYGGGGAIAYASFGGRLNINESVFDSNQTSGPQGGGAILAKIFEGGTGSTFGVIADVRIDGSLLLNNKVTDQANATVGGGAISSIGSNEIQLRTTIFATTLMNNSVESTSGTGGAISSTVLNGSPSNTLNVAESTFSGNHAFSGGAIATNATYSTILTSTITLNTASVDETGGIYLSTNPLQPANQLEISGTILDANSGHQIGTDGGMFNLTTSNGYNLINGTVENVPNGFVFQSTDITGTPANLSALTPNGAMVGSPGAQSAIQTHIPLPGSEAIDNGGTTALFDQIGTPRPQGSAPDIGAIEFVFNGPAVVYVDDNFSNPTPGQDPDAGGPATEFGVDAFATIQEAIDNVADGGTVIIAAGTYLPSSTITVSKSITIQGAQAGVDPRPGTGSLRDETDDSTETIIDGGGSLSRIFLIDADNVTLDGLVITNGTGDLVRSSNPVDNITVQYNIIHNSTGDEGVQLANASNSSIQYNYIFDTEGDGANFAYSSNSNISFNELRNVRSTNGAIYVYDSEAITIEGNLLDLDHLNQNDGIKVIDEIGADTTTSYIINNVVIDSLQDGITVERSNVIVSGNDVSGSTSENGVIYVSENVDNVQITNNSIHDNLASVSSGQINYAIRIGKAFGNHPTNVVIRDNSIVNNEALIFFQQDTQANLDASRNWWGTADSAVIAAGIVGVVDGLAQTNGAIDFSTILTSGADTNGVAPGFQPDTSTLSVHTFGGEPENGSRIQNAINLVDASGTVEVQSGTYTENVTVNRGITLSGTPDIQGILTVTDGATLAPGFSPGIIHTNGLNIQGDTFELNNINLGSFTHLDVGPGEDLRYVESVQGENILFWRGSTGELRRATYTWNGTNLVLGAITSPTGLTSGDHASILNMGGGVLEGYFHTGTGPSVTSQYHAISNDGGQTWINETLIPYPFPTPGIGSDSGTTGGGGIIEINGERRIYAQNNFGDIVLWTTDAGSNGPLTNVGALIDGSTGNFQNQSPSGDAIGLSSGQTLYLYVDGEGSESTLGAIGALIVDPTGLVITSQIDNFISVSNTALSSAGLTRLDEMTIGAVQIAGNMITGVLMIDGDSVANGSNEDLFYAPITINTNSVPAGSLDIEINGTTPGTEYDQIDVTGTVTIGAGATLNLIDGYDPAAGEQFVLINNDGVDPVVGTFAGLDEGHEFSNFLGVSGLTAFLTYTGGDGNDVSIVVQDPTPQITLPVNGTANNYTLSLVGPNLVLTDNDSGMTISTIPLLSLGGPLVIDGEPNQDDRLTVDLTGIDETTPLQIIFNGGTGGNDELVLSRTGSLASVEHVLVDASSGNIIINGAVTPIISYTGLEPITDNLDVTDRVFTFTGAAETITLSDDGDLNDGESFIDSSLAESVTFLNATNSLTINTELGGGSGIDALNVEGLDEQFNANLIINAGADDSVSFLTNTTDIGSGNLSVTSGTVELDADIIAASISGDAPTVNVLGSAGGADLRDALNLAGIGGTINVAAGTYLTTGTLNLNQAVSIVGAGKEDVEIRKSGAPTTYDEVIHISGNDVSISGAQLGWETHTMATDYRGYVVVTTGDNTTLNNLLFSDNYRSAIVFENADNLEISDSIFEGKFGRAAIRDGNSGSGENFLITRNEFRADHFRWGPIAIGPQGTLGDPNNEAFSGEISFNYFGNGLEAGAFQEQGDQNYTVTITNQGMTADGVDIIHNTFDWQDSATINGVGNFAQSGGIYFDPNLTVPPGSVNITDNIFNGFTYDGPQPTNDPLWNPAGGVFGGALEFDGVDDFGLFQDPAFDVGAAGTLNFWVNMQDQSRRNQFFEGLDDLGFEFQFRENTGGQFFGSPGRGVNNTGDNVVIQDGSAGGTEGVWQNLQYTWNFNGGVNPEMHIYVDGTEVGYLSTTYDADLSQWVEIISTVNQLVTVGRDASGDRHFDGLMDDVGWFNAVLNQTDRDNIRMNGVATLSADARLIAHWDFDQGAGNIAVDNKNGIEMYISANGISPLGPEFRPGMGQFGGALEFDGIDDFATFQDPSFDVGAQGTLSFWVNMQDTGKRNQFFEGPGNQGLEFQFRPNSGGQFYGRVANDGDFVIEDGPSAGVAGTWTNIQYTWDNTTSEMRIYIDGTEVSGYLPGFTPTDLSSFDSMQFIDTINGLMNVGRDPGDSGRYFDGLMDDIAWFDVVLNPAERAEIIGTSVGTSFLNGDPRLVAYWNLDDAPGTTVATGDGGTNIDLNIQAEPPLPPIEGFGVLAPANATVTYNVFHDNDLNSNLPLDPTNILGDPLFAYESDPNYAPTDPDSLAEQFAIGFGSTAAFSSSEHAVDANTMTPHIGAFQDLSLFGAGDIVIDGSGADDLLEITFIDANTATFILTTDVGGMGETVTGPVMLTNITSLTFNGLEGDDLLRVTNPMGGLLDPVNGLIFNGGTGGEDGAGDTLEILGGTATTVEHRFSNDSEGSVFFNGEGTATITYTGLEPIIDNIDAADRIFSFTGADELITLSDGGAAGQSLIDSTLGESVLFLNPTASLTINTEAFGGTGIDTVNLIGADAAFSANLTVNAGANDAINTGTIDIGAGNADLNAALVNVNLAFTTTGSVDIDASSGITFAAAGVIDAGANTIDLQAGIGIMLGQITTTGDVTVTATAGSIFDANAGVNNITANNATLVSGSGAGLFDALETAISALEANIGGGLELDDTGTLNVGFAGGINGVTVGGPSTITSTGTMTVTENVTASGGDLLLQNTGGNFNQNAGTTISNTGAFEIGINSTGQVNLIEDSLINSSGNGLIDIDAVNDVNVVRITTGGEVQITTSAGAIIDNKTVNLFPPNIIADSLSLLAATGIGDTAISANLGVNVNTLSASSSSGNIVIFEHDSVNVGTVNGISGLFNNGYIDLLANNSITVDQDVRSTNLDSIVSIRSGNQLTVNAAIESNDGTINLLAFNDLILGSASSIDTTTSAYINLRADLNNSGTGEFTQNEGSIINARGGLLSIHASEDINLTNLVSIGGQILIETTNGAIIDNTVGEGTLITGGEAAFLAATGIGNFADGDIDTAVSTLTASTPGGNINIYNMGALDIGAPLFIGMPLSDVEANTGSIDITSASPLTVSGNVTGAGTVTLTSTDGAGPGDDLTINAGVTVESTGADVVLNSGDNFLLTLTGEVIAATTIEINVDPSAGDPDAAGATVDLLGNVDATLTTINGGDDEDTFNILPTGDSPITINGGDPTLPGPGDVLNMDFSGLTNPPVLTLGMDAGSGEFSFLAPDLQLPVTYSSIENVTTSTGAYHLVLDMLASGFQDGAADDINVALDATGTDLQIAINPSIFFTGAIADILSFTVLGSSDSDSLHVNETAGGLPFFATAAPPVGISSGSHLNAAADFYLEDVFNPNTYDVNDITFHFDGGGGMNDAFRLITSINTYNVGYFSDLDDALGSGNIVAAQSGNTDIDFGFSFARLEGLDFLTYSGGELHVDASATPMTNQIAIDSPSLLSSYTEIMGNGGFTDLVFDGYQDLVVVSGPGSETIDLIAVGPGSNITSIVIDADDVFGTNAADNDVIRVHSAPLGVLNINILAAAGDDVINVFDAGNTVDNINAQIMIDGEGGNDTLTIIDSGDLTGDTFEITSTTVEGLTSAAGTDITYMAIDNLNVTGTDGNDDISVNLTTQEDLNNVTINGFNGDDDFSLQNGSTPMGVDTRLNGDAGNDEFFFLPGSILRGFIDGGGDVDTIDYTTYAAVVHIALSGLGTIDGFQGRENNGSILGTGIGSLGFDNIDDLLGSGLSDTLEGPDLNNYWGITSTDTGFIIADRPNLMIGRPTTGGDATATPPEQFLSFLDFENLIGGSLNDRFDLSDGAGLTGTLNGDLGNDSLDYRDYTTGVNVDLFAGTATNIGGGLALGTGGGDDDNSIENVFGGDGNDNITGDNDNNILGDGFGSDNLDGGGNGVGSENGGNDVFLMEPGAGGSVDVITDIHGNDTVDFRFASQGIVFDADIINTPQDVFGGNTVELRQIQPQQPDTNPSFMENVVGSEFNDLIFIDPLSQDGNFPIDGPPVLRSVDGRGGNDTLDFDAKGQEVIDTGFSLTADGVGTVQYLNFENVRPFEDNPGFIVDNGDSAFTITGDWPYHPAGTAAITNGIGFEDDIHTVAGTTPTGVGPAQAFWEFFGLTPGQYRVSVTWPVSTNPGIVAQVATDTPFTVFDGAQTDIGTTAVDLGTSDLNQQIAPNDFSVDGAVWEDLGVFTINSRTLTVMLTNLADGKVTADAIRIERVSAGPEIELTDVTDALAPPALVVDGHPGGIQFGDTELLTPAVRTFEITNNGSAVLNISNITIPAGYTTDLTAQAIGIGSTIQFTITMDASTFGDRSGIFSFDTDDVDEATFNILLDGRVSNVVIVDDGDAEFSATAGFETFTTSVNEGNVGFEGDITGAVPNQPGSTPAPGTETATWTFTDLADGNYRVSTTWSPLYNRVDDAPYSLDGGAGVFDLDVDQRITPGSFVDENGVAWFDLNLSYLVVGGTLTVTLTNDANNFPRDSYDLANGVIADAIRIEYLPEPDLEVTVDMGTVVEDDTGNVDFGSTLPGIPIIKTFTVTNLSMTDVDVTGLIEFPPGFSIDPASPFGTDTVPVTIGGGSSVTFTVQFDGGTNGSTFGQISFTTGDEDENPYNFTVSGTAGPATVGVTDTDFSTTGTWTGHTPGGVGDPEFLYAGDYVTGGVGANTATWSFDVEPGRYQVVAHWYVHPDVTTNGHGAASNAPYTIFDDVTPVTTVLVNQQTSSDDFLDDGTFWEFIGDPVVITSDALNVLLTDNANGIVYADEIRIYRVVDPVISVEVDGVEVEDGSSVDFEETIVGAAVVKTFTITNSGERNMALGTINLPAGFTLISGFGNDNLPPGASTTFTMQMDAATAGPFGGMVSFGVDSADANPFNFTVTGSAQNSMIVDNGDLNYSNSGPWETFSTTTAFYEYFQQDQDVLDGGDLPGSNTASWSFNNLGAGAYQVSAHWFQHSSLAPDAQITISGIEGGPVTVSLDQRFAPNDFSADGTNWEELGDFQVAAGGTLTVTITDDGASGDIAADAMRLELIPVGMQDPEIEVQAGAVDLVSGVSSLDLGTTGFGESLFQTFTITNTGTDTLNLGAITTPANFSVFSGPGTTTLFAGQSTTFVLEFNSTGVSGTSSGTVSIANNDADEAPFDIDVSATMSAVQIVDDRDADYSDVGNWQLKQGASLFYYQTDGQQLNQGENGTATWNFTGLAAGTYTVSTTWYHNVARATNAEYNIGTGPIVVNQRVAPNDFNSEGEDWEILGTIAVGAGGSITVTLSDNVADGSIIADAVRIERTGPLVAAAGESSTPAASITQADLDAVRNAALTYWSATGLTADEMDRLQSVSFVLADLPDAMLGGATSSTILIDVNAAGYGWFVDDSPFDSSEFTLDADGNLVADADSEAFGRMDLLTVVMHELGHTLGYDDLDAAEAGNDLMSESLNDSQRRLPEIDDADASDIDDFFSAITGGDNPLLN
ncbi:golvesin C-terminal-like domain-containing protein [Gimesia fumaroli]|uniref:Uncharacterized protein n=1 Tax=Gimesia fumaroli TaxID=2527976 RepID=A0A518I9M6_9PLAN|nr:LamG-like jellyroll fold domain-containing protein [Gimesia fumaroli]QDV49759.1 hypothetical protein Enr17x_17800 [Gimesia fumaroli]